LGAAMSRSSGRMKVVSITSDLGIQAMGLAFQGFQGRVANEMSAGVAGSRFRFPRHGVSRRQARSPRFRANSGLNFLRTSWTVKPNDLTRWSTGNVETRSWRLSSTVSRTWPVGRKLGMYSGRLRWPSRSHHAWARLRRGSTRKSGTKYSAWGMFSMRRKRKMSQESASVVAVGMGQEHVRQPDGLDGAFSDVETDPSTLEPSGRSRDRRWRSLAFPVRWPPG
jgi:hypothetical protein